MNHEWRDSEPERLGPQTDFELCLTASAPQNKSLSFCLAFANKSHPSQEAKKAKKEGKIKRTADPKPQHRGADASVRRPPSPVDNHDAIL